MFDTSKAYILTIIQKYFAYVFGGSKFHFSSFVFFFYLFIAAIRIYFFSFASDDVNQPKIYCTFNLLALVSSKEK